MREINSFIDICLIKEYSKKSLDNGYSLDIDDVPQNDRSHFLDLLMNHDTDVKDQVLSMMQSWINDRLQICEMKDNFQNNVHVNRTINGDYSWSATA